MFDLLSYLSVFLPQCSTLCDSIHGSVHDKDNSPMMRACEAHS